MGRTYVALLHEYLEEMEELTDEEFGRLCRGLLRYSATGEVFEPSGNERFFVRHHTKSKDNCNNQNEKYMSAYRLLFLCRRTSSFLCLLRNGYSLCA